MKNVPDKQSAARKFSIWGMLKNRPTVFVTLIGLVAVATVFCWKNMENKHQKTMIITAANKQLETNQEDLLKIMVKPMVWSLRTEMLRANMEQANILITDMVKEKNFQYIHIITPNGIVLLSTNKSMEAKPIGAGIDASLLLLEAPAFVTSIDNVLVVVAPIMGVDKRLATLVVGYKTVSFTLNK